mgnify:CR=1 FL=1
MRTNIRKFIWEFISLVLCQFIALNAVTKLLNLSNTIANIVGVVLFLASLVVSWKVLNKIINKAKKNED